jgi:S1-C subfamily serine protease
VRARISAIGLAVVLAGCASKPGGRSKPPAVPISTKEAVALQTTGVGAEGSDLVLNGLMETARIVPYPKSGKKLTGFLLEAVEPDSPWTRAGLKKGDIVINVGDTPMTTREDLMTLFYAVGKPGTAPIAVLRRPGRHRRRETVVLNPQPPGQVPVPQP